MSLTAGQYAALDQPADRSKVEQWLHGEKVAVAAQSAQGLIYYKWWAKLLKFLDTAASACCRLPCCRGDRHMPMKLG